MLLEQARIEERTQIPLQASRALQGSEVPEISGSKFEVQRLTLAYMSITDSSTAVLQQHRRTLIAMIRSSSPSVPCNRGSQRLKTDLHKSQHARIPSMGSAGGVLLAAVVWLKAHYGRDAVHRRSNCISNTVLVLGCGAHAGAGADVGGGGGDLASADVLSPGFE